MVDPNSGTWNLDLLNEIIVSEDVVIIRSISVSRTNRPDTLGWHFTKSGKYTVKSGYHTNQIRNNEILTHVYYGPDIRPLQIFTWKLKCPQKLKHFIWQTLSGCVSITTNLNHRGINCDTQCARCGLDETINHVLFECPPAVQIWALSKAPSTPGIFPMTSIFANLDYHFWRIVDRNQNQTFPWIIWYIWKARNDKGFKNLDRDSQEVLQLAEQEAMLWKSA